MTDETTEQSESGKRTWTEEIEVAGHQVLDEIQRLIEQGNARRVILRNKSGKTLLEVPLTAGVAVGGAAALMAPVAAAIGALVALVAEVKLEIERVEDDAIEAELEAPAEE
jgi:hypothetical protein